MSSLGIELYSDSASPGVIESYIGLIIAVVGIILVIVAIYLFSVNQSNLVDETAEVVSATCIPQTDPHGNITYDCNLDITYIVNAKEYTGKIVANSSTSYQTGESVDITYDSQDPFHVTAKQSRDKTLAWILLGIGILIVGGASVKYYMSTRFKMFATA